MSREREGEPQQPGPLLKYATPVSGVAAGLAALTVALWPMRLEWADAFSAGASSAFMVVLIVEVLVMVLSEGRIRSAHEARVAAEARADAAEARADAIEQARQEEREARIAAQRRLERLIAALIESSDVDPRILEALKE